MHFYYDEQGRPAIVNYGGSTYHYLYDLQDDVIGLVDSSGSLVVEYKYDAWGKPLGKSGTLATTLGTLNPFRYRGYVYDEETGLYYLRSRYYNPEWGRFISADALLGKTGVLFSHNLFCYCGNNPVVRIDVFGHLSVYIMYDDRKNTNNKHEKGGFGNQANHIKWCYILREFAMVEMCPYHNIGDEDVGFIDVWNSLESREIDILIIIGHGAPGTIACNNQTLDNTGEYNYNDLKEITVNIGIELYTCNGATPDEDGGMSTLEKLMLKSNCYVGIGLYYAKTRWLFDRYLIPNNDTIRRDKYGIPSDEAQIIAIDLRKQW